MRSLPFLVASSSLPAGMGTRRLELLVTQRGPGVVTGYTDKSHIEHAARATGPLQAEEAWRPTAFSSMGKKSPRNVFPTPRWAQT